jgi:uncharacterized protein (TIGR02285 family)
MAFCFRPWIRRLHPGPLAGLFCVYLWIAVAPPAEAKETIVWVLRELPPLTIFEGALRNQGAVDKTLALLIQSLPEYDHVIQRVNRARAMQMLQGHELRCDPTLLWTPERAKFVVFSTPSVVTLSNGLIIRPQDRPLFEPFMSNHEVDLDALLHSGVMHVGLVAERSYGPFMDQVLKQAPANSLARHYGNDAVASLMQMEQLGRLQALIGYRTEARYLAGQQGLALDQISFLPIKGVEKYQFNHVGCSDTPAGRAAIGRIDGILHALRQDTLSQFYAFWLDTASRADYLQDAKTFFTGNAVPGVLARPASAKPNGRQKETPIGGEAARG